MLFAQGHFLSKSLRESKENCLRRKKAPNKQTSLSNQDLCSVNIYNTLGGLHGQISGNLTADRCVPPISSLQPGAEMLPNPWHRLSFPWNFKMIHINIAESTEIQHNSVFQGERGFHKY